MKKLILAAVLALTGCQVQTYQYGSGDTKQIYTVVSTPEQSFSIFATNKTSQTSGSVAVPITSVGVGPSVNVSGSNATSSTVVTLADSLDQVNTQLLGAYKAALFGLNANPTGVDNRAQFWKTVNGLNDYGYQLRIIALADAATTVSKQVTAAKETNRIAAVSAAKSVVGAPATLTPVLSQVASGNFDPNVVLPTLNATTGALKAQLAPVITHVAAYQSLDQTETKLHAATADILAQVAKIKK